MESYPTLKKIDEEALIRTPAMIRKEYYDNVKHKYHYVYTDELEPGALRFKMTVAQKVYTAIASIVLFKLGYEIANRFDVVGEDMTKYVLRMEREEQLYDVLIHQRKPAFVFYYIPGDLRNIKF